jgi:drug/metabolite transporter (DMT)-like permease
MPAPSRIGPWLVALGAALWGTESAWRIPLNGLLPDADVLVFWEHVVLVALALPFILPRLGELRGVRRRTLAALIFSGVAGSAVGAVFFTLALQHGNATVINVVLNVQPVLSTGAAYLLFRDRLAPTFFPWAALAIGCGMVLVGVLGGGVALDGGVPYALICALFWGLSTVAGRGVMVEMSLPLAAGLRVVIGLASMTVILAARGLLTGAALWPQTAQAAPGHTVVYMLLLATLSGGVPLIIYFAGLRLTRASTAGYFEMMQTLAAVLITWGFFGDALSAIQVAGAIGLVAAVAMVQRAQATVEDSPPDAAITGPA